LFLRYYNLSNGFLETQQIIKTDSFLIEFGPTLHYTGNFWTPASTDFSYGKKKQINFPKQHVLFGTTRFWIKCLFP